MTSRIDPTRWTDQRRTTAEEMARAGIRRQEILTAVNAIDDPPLDYGQLYAYLYKRGLAGNGHAPKSESRRQTNPAHIARERAYRSKPSLHTPQRGGEAMRPCMCCRVPFKSWGIGNRICDGCKKA